jgi:hypothetical protein
MVNLNNVQIEQENQTNSPEQRLWKAVLAQAVYDALFERDIILEAEKKSARDWFLFKTKSFYETCHNAGSQYSKLQTMKDHAKSVAAGMSDFSAEGAVEKLCAECHNEKSPTYKGFDFAKRWAEIEHNYPDRKLVVRQTK